MASAFGHALTALALGSSYKKQQQHVKFLLLGVFCSVIPDADVLSFRFGVHYEDFWGHRGFMHSIVFAVLLAALLTFFFYRDIFLAKKGIIYMLFFTLCGVSHGILDAMTTGGLGVAFFSPFNTERYFFPWRPISVSPIGAGKFFGPRGIAVLKSEAVWIGIPCVVYMAAMRLLRSLKRTK